MLLLMQHGMFGVLDVLSQALPGLEHLAAEGAGHAAGVDVIGLDVELNVLLHLGTLPTHPTGPAQLRRPVHHQRDLLIQS